MTTPPAPARAPVQHLRIERRGGLAGLRAGADADFAALPLAAQQALTSTLARSDAGTPTTPTPGADRYTYRLHLVHADGAQRVVEVGEDEMPEALSELVRPILP